MEQVNKNIVNYFSILQVKYRKALTGYEGKASSFSFVNVTMNIKDFFLDDNLSYVWDCRVNGATQWKVELLVLPIGPYRTISLSMILDFLHKLKKKLCFDQLIALCQCISTRQVSHRAIGKGRRALSRKHSSLL